MVDLVVKVWHAPDAGNGHFSDLQTTANDVRKAEKIFYRKCNLKSLLTETTLAGQYKIQGLRWKHFLNNDKNQFKMNRKST